jgi:hypothetical protein
VTSLREYNRNARIRARQRSGSAAHQALAAELVAVALFMENLDATIVNTAVPTIAASLEVAPLALKGVLASYTQAYLPCRRRSPRC